ncbi:hypothetical protein MGYG_08579 [Nannizzia gypsea CBS 118893]|uniref:Xylanolytic transcriptional activator regulatory domain-containing protein n=1 Tax=Arthroderma gypseum (strain ATCC MYA-4604 / CBS 118893) TaxID=535722 RepID=E4V6E0_ARTGP|nr:hypothetical protein MGYG_08579 [Nannizzia gypsea CBS 118893]EFQ96656.1 hypothetical protein MGYG_08579 [Nannizzia gypsea CBS 118893]
MLLIDRLLQDGPQQNHQTLLFDETAVIKASNSRVSSSVISFFSNQRIEILTDHLEANDLKLRQLPETPEVTAAEADAYIEAYFENLHPLYPFLDRQEFASLTRELRIKAAGDTNKSLSALYHAVLALGSQYCDGGSFVPGSGKSWGLFQISLRHLSDLIVPAYSLLKLQSNPLQSIFAMNPSCIKLDQTLIYEAARVAQHLRYHKSSNAQEKHLRLFCTIHYIEKMTAFYESNSSVIADGDIGCVVPAVSDSTVAGYDWFLSANRLSRLCSMTYTSLFSTEATLKTKTSFLGSIKRIQSRLEQWRSSVPMAYRPGKQLDRSGFERLSTKLVVIQAHCLYYTLVIAVERLSLHVNSEYDVENNDHQQNLMEAAQSVIELVPFIDLALHMPVFYTSFSTAKASLYYSKAINSMAGIMPMSAMFVLFDLVVCYPRHSETNKNLALLDQAAEYFTRLEMISKGILPGRNIAEFTTIARHYIRKLKFDDARPRGALSWLSSIPNLVHRPGKLEQWNPDIELNNLFASSADNMGSLGSAHPAIESSVALPMAPNFPLDPAILLEKLIESDYPNGSHSMFDILFPGWAPEDTGMAELSDVTNERNL